MALGICLQCIPLASQAGNLLSQCPLLGIPCGHTLLPKVLERCRVQAEPQLVLIIEEESAFISNHGLEIMLQDPTKTFAAEPEQVCIFPFAVMPQLVARTEHVLILALQRPSAHPVAGDQ